MCSEYKTPTSPKQIEAALDLSFVDKTKEFEWGAKMNFFKDGPVIQKNSKGDLELLLKTFPTSPMPNSRLSGLDGQSDGGEDKDVDDKQIKRIYEMPRWKEGFKTHPLLVPMQQFTEFAYWGDKIGTAQGFKLPKHKVFFAAGISINPFAPKGPAFSGYSILTHTATPQMLEFHQRLIVILEAKLAVGFLEEMSPQDRFNYLIENRYTGKFEVEKIRDMAKGWQKRVDTQTAKLNREIKYREVLQKEGVAG